MIPHSLAYNRRMKKIASIVSIIVLTMLLAFTLTACFGNVNSPSSASPSDSNASSQVVTSVSSASNTASAPAPADDSYAENHLVKETYSPPDISVTKKGEYTDKDHVALYIHTYGKVPPNYVTKTKARNAGWVNTDGNLWDVLPGKSIGGGGFYNDDNVMPDAPGRSWYECDIDYDGGFRNAKRIVYSNDGLIYYTDDHYKTFQRLY